MDEQEPLPIIKKLSQIWEILNSGFVLLIFSGVILNVVATLYKQYEISEQDRIVKQRLYDHAVVELTHRFKLMEQVLSKTKVERQDILSLKRIFEGYAPYIATNKEFNQVSILSIISEVGKPINPYQQTESSVPFRGPAISRLDGQNSTLLSKVTVKQREAIFSIANMLAYVEFNTDISKSYYSEEKIKFLRLLFERIDADRLLGGLNKPETQKTQRPTAQ